MYLTDRLVIERLVEAHADSLFASFLDERLYQFIPERPPKNLETMRREFRDFEAGAPTVSGELWLNWVVRLKAGGDSIGTLQATRFADGLLWLGYKFAPRVWGNGYASESLRWLVAELAQSCGQQQLLAAVDIRNEASVRVLERTGFNRLRTEAASLHGAATEDYVYVFEL